MDTAIFSWMSRICVGPVPPARPPSLSEQSLSGLLAICKLRVCFVHTDTALFVCVCVCTCPSDGQLNVQFLKKADGDEPFSIDY